MFYTDKKLQFPVRVETPSPIFARALQQAIGGVEGEIRVALQYFFQAWGARGPSKYRDLLLNTATEELAHIEMLATAVALNLEGAPLSLQEDISADTIGGSVLNGMNFRHILSTGLAALPENSNGVPFNASHVYASGNLAADMIANVTAESSGRVLATRLYNMTDDPGMKEMLSFLIARDTMHQQQWLAAIEDMGGLAASLPVPNSFPQEQELRDVSYAFVNCFVDGVPPPEGRWSSGKSIDGNGEFTTVPGQPMGEEPMLGSPRADSGAQSEQIGSTQGSSRARGSDGNGARA
ncbi:MULTISPECIES: manganese catalase family protein [unclassified Mesorhizobium]|uniref:manganese catalase family protein n=1 Tax=unclassified Mesorhizobium TaxID=325217 RepID=UPI00112BD773|nr:MULTISPECIES: manganese catalase family protein [unclassified Mesorhizobium]MBZ9898266.1 manganese catalase family protein [Mesorhizobium sp. BR1-1-6]TPM57373.1 catalase [Mesorhizobium sp. B2-2-4]TPM65823.1 catalase [Mesorhizobium sp. B2-2-1]TPN30265.1 catalase [Mesorhizobium sp. B1-1-6]TPN72149.1 catalase [Mesorhizobium sp. B1-1-3]